MRFVFASHFPPSPSRLSSLQALPSQDAMRGKKNPKKQNENPPERKIKSNQLQPKPSAPLLLLLPPPENPPKIPLLAPDARCMLAPPRCRGARHAARAALLAGLGREGGEHARGFGLGVFGEIRVGQHGSGAGRPGGWVER